jgi:O-antigen/teichoic acid export membrane protein
MTPQPEQKNHKLFGLKWQSPLDISRTHSVLWNGISRLLQVGLQFLFVPIYVSLLGPASYGLVVLSATLMATFAFLDHAISNAMSREFGMHNGNPERSSDMWKILSTLERFSVLVALVMATLALFFGFYFTRHWTKSDGLDETTLWIALVLIGGIVASQFIGILYAAALMGLQRQKLLSVVRICWIPAYYCIGAVLLFIVERSVVVLFAWQITAFLTLAFIMRFIVRKTMPDIPAGQHSNYRVSKEIGRFGAGSLIVGLSGAAVSQIDKFMVASSSQPEQFAAYGLALSIVMQAMTLASGPFATAMYPHFSQLVSEKDETVLRQTYHRWAQVIAIVSALTGGLLFLAGPLLIDLWLGTNSVLAPDIKRLLPIVLVAWVINGTITTPVMLIMAAGRLYLIYGINLVAIALAAVFLPYALRRWGFEAGAFYWLAVNLAYCLVIVPLMHGFTLKGSLLRWISMDVAVPLTVAGCVFYCSSLLISPNAGAVYILAHAIASVSICCAALIVVMPDGRRQLLQSLRFLHR